MIIVVAGKVLSTNTNRLKLHAYTQGVYGAIQQRPAPEKLKRKGRFMYMVHVHGGILSSSRDEKLERTMEVNLG